MSACAKEENQYCGVYFHIPFCRSKCVYCDFYSLSNVKNAPQTVLSMGEELSARSLLWRQKKVSTVYFGGGTPSLLPAEDIGFLLSTLKKHFTLDPTAEITIEANPDDISLSKALQWREMGVNRVSVGVQSFSSEVLKKIGRSHSSETAKKAIAVLHEAGFENITLDIIYGIPLRNDDVLRSDIQTAIDTGVKHISSYALTVEQGTELDIMIRRGTFPKVNDDDALRQYEIVCQMLKDAGFEHYEVSNFALSGYRSRHNSAYWHGVPYMGIGPAAHSYDGTGRRWNVSSVAKYIDGVKNGNKYWEDEVLTKKDIHNEMIMTRLRCVEGVSLSDVKAIFGSEYSDRIEQIAEKYISEGLMQKKDDNISLTEKGVFLSDGIEADMFITDEMDN